MRTEDNKETKSHSRCYLRGCSPLGLFNTLIGCIIGLVLVKEVDVDTGKAVDWYWNRAARWSKEEIE